MVTVGRQRPEPAGGALSPGTGGCPQLGMQTSLDASHVRPLQSAGTQGTAAKWLVTTAPHAQLSPPPDLSWRLRLGWGCTTDQGERAQPPPHDLSTSCCACKGGSLRSQTPPAPVWVSLYIMTGKSPTISGCGKHTCHLSQVRGPGPATLGETLSPGARRSPTRRSRALLGNAAAGVF